VVKRTVKEGTVVKVGQAIGTIDTDAKVGAAPKAAGPAPAKAEVPKPKAEPELMPAARRASAELKVDPADVKGTGKAGRVLKEDVEAHAKTTPFSTETVRPEVTIATPVEIKPAAVQQGVAPTTPRAPEPTFAVASSKPGERRQPMSKIRKRIAENLVRAKQETALLTTFNEVDMSAIMALRNKYKDAFEKKHQVGLGFMSFFVRACCIALRDFERVNGQIDGDDVVLFDHVHMGVAVSTERGLTVPVLKNAHQMSFAKIENEIKRVATAAKDGKLGLDELSGGTFTITNGGIFGSLLSTPIINPPQSAILGMHAIQQRPIAVDGKVEIRPMMYLALSYDHRIIDGRESVTFLVKVKNLLEDPARLMLDV
jgi:2-oxoglutarate dehydrogenase E2 component (dihydrolipoamide succinyltransferase)